MGTTPIGGNMYNKSCSIYELAKLAVQSKDQVILRQYDKLEFDLEQQYNLAKYMVQVGQVRRVIKVPKIFHAVRGEYHFDHQLEDLEVVEFKPDFYLTSLTSIPDVNLERARDNQFEEHRTRFDNHTHIYDHDGSILTVVKVDDYRKLPFKTFCQIETDVELVLRISDVAEYYSGVDSLRLSRCDIEKRLRVSSDETAILVDDDISKGFHELLQVLIDKTGASNEIEAIAIAIAQSDEAELERSRQENSFEYGVLKQEMRLLEREGLHGKKLHEVVDYLRNKYCKGNTETKMRSRQPEALSQILYDIFKH